MGESALGQWEEEGLTRPAFHVRRRLTPKEELLVGPVVDVRGTPEADRRLAYVRTLIPDYTEE